MDCPQIDLYEFLTESELQHYYNAVKNELKITNAAQFKYATDEDLKHIGLSRPEIRRLRKFYEKHFPHGYLSKIKRLLQAPATIVKREDGTSVLASQSITGTTDASGATTKSSPGKVPNNKHIIPADSISVNKQLGTGEFGIVQQGVWTNGTERIQVAIKCLCRERMQSNPMEFLKEAAIMHSIEHENIVRLYGVVLATDSLMLVTELAHLRSLLECLKDPGLRVSFLTIPTLCEFAMQICNGMRYLENKRLIHRDLAARNILVFSKNKVKISDFGLSRALGVGKDYYKTNFNVNLKLPIAWCAPECINYLRFTNASDVWAFGVCLWEMFSYGFQPWAALTGLQILEAIDAPNYQRLEQPDCCPSEYYTLMRKCWQDDPSKRPKFSEIYDLLPDMKPEQLKAVVNCSETKKDHLTYHQGEIITVLDRNTGTPFWKGVLSSGKTGFFNPSNTVAYLEGLPSSNRDSFCRVSERSSKRKLRTEMISKPQNDFKHTGHVGIDGASFGDIAFLGNSQSYNHVPRQIVTPYKPSEDIEQTPLLLPPTPTSPDSLQTASGYFAEGNGSHSMNPSFVPSTENTPKQVPQTGQTSFDFPSTAISNSTNPFVSRQNDDDNGLALQNNNYGGLNDKGPVSLDKSGMGTDDDARNVINHAAEVTWRSLSTSHIEDPHEYHEISDDEIAGDKLDFGPSLLEEINSMIGSMTASSTYQRSPDFDCVNIKNEFTEMSSKATRKQQTSGGDSNGNKFGMSLSKKKTAGTVKPISVKDEKILNHAIEIANEISARSMNDLVTEPASSAQSPKRKFSFRFPHLSNNGSHEKSNHSSSPSAGSVTGIGGSSGGCGTGTAGQKVSSPFSKKKNFTEELKSIPDLQSIIGEEGREAYNNLIERKASLASTVLNPTATLLKHFETNEFEMSSKTLPRRSLHAQHDTNGFIFEQLRHGDEEISYPVAVPTQLAPRPMTLPNRGKIRKSDLLLGDSNKPSSLDYTNSPAHDGISIEMNCPCESPSYLTNTSYKFADQPEENNFESVNNETGSINPLPIPSREGKKHIKTNAKRHVRKYPLIIPANGVQRTLNKVTESTSTDDDAKDVNTMTSVLTDNNIRNPNKITFEVVPTVRALTGSGSSDHDKPVRSPSDEHTYQNLENSPTETLNCPDSASVQFESILEADNNQCSSLQSPDVTDSFYNFSIQKEHYTKGKGVGFDKNKISGLYVNEDELRNLDIEGNLKVAMQTAGNDSGAPVSTEHEVKIPIPVKPERKGLTKITPPVLPAVESSDEKAPQSVSMSAESELAGNALFRKVRESVNLAMNTTNPMTSSNRQLKSNIPCPAENVSSPANVGSSSVSDQKQQKYEPPQQTEGEYFASVAARLADSNSVSCEDLLEFADKKPKGSERGVDSDEVRIMMKVLGKDSTPPRCLDVLEFIGWDVHKAIKVIKLQNLMAHSNPSSELTLTQSIDALQQSNWDICRVAFHWKVNNKI